MAGEFATLSEAVENAKHLLDNSPFDSVAAESCLVDLRSRFLGECQDLPAYTQRQLEHTLRALEQKISIKRKPVARPFTFSTNPSHLIQSQTASQAIPIGDVSGKRSEILDFSSIAIDRQTLSLLDVDHCLIDLAGMNLSSVNMKSMSHCIISTPHLSGSILIDHAENSLLFLDAQQVRLHDCQNCTLVLVSSNTPVTENCRQLRLTSSNSVVNFDNPGSTALKDSSYDSLPNFAELSDHLRKQSTSLKVQIDQVLAKALPS